MYFANVTGLPQALWNSTAANWSYSFTMATPMQAESLLKTDPRLADLPAWCGAAICPACSLTMTHSKPGDLHIWKCPGCDLLLNYSQFKQIKLNWDALKKQN